MRVLHTTAKTRAPTEALRAAKPAGRFGLHLVEMCAVMCVGGGPLIVLFFAAAAALGFADLQVDSPVLSSLVSASLLTAAMVGWMRLRRMDWRPALQMAASSMSAAGLLILGYGAGVVGRGALVGSVCLVACLAMLAVMLLRADLYSR
jgi:hypothetical protein